MKYCITLILILFTASAYGQTPTPTFFESGINSPWAIGFDYDIGFAKVMSFNLAFVGGINSQVNRISTFGDVFFGEFQTGPRIYLNKPDKWCGVYIAPVVRVGVYNIPLRVSNNPVVLTRSTVMQYGAGIYLGYRWKRPLVSNMKGLPFIMTLEPYLGWTWDFFAFGSASNAKASNINRFSIGLSFKLSFYTYRYTPGSMVTNQDGTIVPKSSLTNETTTNTNK